MPNDVDTRLLGESAVSLLDGSTTTLSSVIANRNVVLVFLRHFGCVGCAQQITQLSPFLRQIRDLGSQLVLVGNGRLSHARAFMERHRLNERQITLVLNAERDAYRAAGLERSVWSTTGPSAILGQLRAFAAGHAQRRIQGDTWQQGGLLVLSRTGTVELAYRNRFVGDHVEPGRLLEVVTKLGLSRARNDIEPII